MDEGSDEGPYIAALLRAAEVDVSHGLARSDVAETVSLARLALKVAGVRVGEPCGDIALHDGWATIGTVITTADSIVEVVPRRGIGGSQLLHLTAVAAHVSLYGREGARQWEFDEGLGWIALVEAHSDPAPPSKLGDIPLRRA